MPRWLAVWLFFVASLATPLYAQPALRLTYVEVRRFGAEFTPVEINARGEIAGQLAQGRGAVWTADTFRVLPVIGPPDLRRSLVASLNDAGDAVGYQIELTASGGIERSRALLWPASGSVVDLGLFDNESAQAVDINNAGQVLVNAVSALGIGSTFLWTAGSAVQIPRPAFRGIALNDRGHVVGDFWNQGLGPFCFLWSATDGLEVLASSDCFPTAINNSDTVAVLLGSGVALWTRAGGFQTLWGLEDHDGSVVTDLNDTGVVIGILRPLEVPTRTFVWSAATGATIIGGSGTRLYGPTDVNDKNELITPDSRVLKLVTERVPDADGDGEADLFWRGDDGALAIWLMRSGRLADGFQVRPQPSRDWRFAATADFNRDGYLDVLWRRERQLAIWYMRDGALLDGQLLPNEAPAEWRLIGAGDANGDRWPDIYYQHVGTGQIAVWMMRNAALTDGVVLPVVSNAEAEGIADLNGDGVSDLIFRGANGMNAAVMLPVGMISKWLALPAINDPLWRLRANADLNGDGRSDLVWQHADGRVAVWNMSRSTILDGFYLTGPMNFWQIAGPR